VQDYLRFRSQVVEVQKINKMGGMTDQAHLIGLMNLAGQDIQGQPIPGNGAANHVSLVAQDDAQKDIAKILGDQLSKLMNEVRAFAQRLQEQQQQAASQNGADPEAMAKIQNDRMLAEAKAANTRESHAARTAQRQVQFEMEQERANVKTAAEIQRENARFSQEMQQEAVKTMAEAQKTANEKPANGNTKKSD